MFVFKLGVCIFDGMFGGGGYIWVIFDVVENVSVVVFDCDFVVFFCVELLKVEYGLCFELILFDFGWFVECVIGEFDGVFFDFGFFLF